MDRTRQSWADNCVLGSIVCRVPGWIIDRPGPLSAAALNGRLSVFVCSGCPPRSCEVDCPRQHCFWFRSCRAGWRSSRGFRLHGRNGRSRWALVRAAVYPPKPISTQRRKHLGCCSVPPSSSKNAHWRLQCAFFKREECTLAAAMCFLQA